MRPNGQQQGDFILPPPAYMLPPAPYIVPAGSYGHPLASSPTEPSTTAPDAANPRPRLHGLPSVEEDGRAVPKTRRLRHQGEWPIGIR
ncbi:hypothetical protein B0H14DRAFT_3869537 [Mycena olivaceomarginata]|nr:hypothetical protein B0H14DRAFT_3869537 [Mycena olivaceomarginata]